MKVINKDGLEILETDMFELRYMIDFPIISTEGLSSEVLYYDNHYIKLEENLYSGIRGQEYNGIRQKVPISSLEYIFKGLYDFVNIQPFVKPEQLKYLCSLQNRAKRIIFDRGYVIAKIAPNNPWSQIVGVNLNYHRGFSDLHLLDTNDIRLVYEILVNCFLDIEELAFLGVSQLDFNRGKSINIMHKGSETRLCDLSGLYVTYGPEFNLKEMCIQYAIVIQKLYKETLGKYHSDFKELASLIQPDNFKNLSDCEDEIKKLGKRL